MSARGNWQGVKTIALLNWPFYAAAVVVLAAALATASIAHEQILVLAAKAATLGTLWFLGGSLGVTYLVYDRSDLYRLGWLERVLPAANRSRLIFCHSGFDDLSPLLKEKLPEAHWMLLDHYDPAHMTEASIRRARHYYPPPGKPTPAASDRWPVESGSAEAVFGLLAIHELRSEAERGRWFAEAKRALASGGRIILAEHLRDAANFLAFGPGFLHFHTRASWRRSWERAGLRTTDELPITPWVRIFVLAPA